MDWILEHRFIVIFLIAFFIIGVSVLIGNIRNSVKLKKAFNNSLKTDNKFYVFNINFNNNSVVWFDRRDVNSRRIIAFEEFKSLFVEKGQKQILEWFAKIKEDQNSCDRYLEVEGLSLDKRKSHFVLLSLNEYYRDKDVLQIEAKTFFNVRNPLIKGKAKNASLQNIKKTRLKAKFNRISNNRGYGFNIDFFYKKENVIVDKNMNDIMLTKMKDELLYFLQSNRYFSDIIDSKDSRLIFLDFKMNEEEEAKDLANKIASFLEYVIAINPYLQIWDFGVGIVAFKDFKKRFDDCMHMLNKCANDAKHIENKQIFYEKEKKATFKNGVDTEIVKQIFEDNALNYLFRPIVNLNRNNLFGYFSYVSSKDQIFSSYNLIANYVNKVQKNKDLFSMVSKYFVTKFFNERPNEKCKLFLNVTLYDFEYINEVLNNISSCDDVSLVLLMEESEVYNNLNMQDKLLEMFSSLKNENLEFALLLKDKDLLLEPKFYENFNYFVLGSSMVSKIKESNRIRLSNKFLIEQLIEFEKPIIATDLDGWQSIELFIRSGLRFVSGNDIAPKSEMLLPLDKRKIEKLKLLKE